MIIWIQKIFLKFYKSHVLVRLEHLVIYFEIGFVYLIKFILLLYSKIKNFIILLLYKNFL